jgi:tetratricopeptide (TPR) repeat protein
MQRLFRRLWQWLKRLLGLGNTSSKGKIAQELPPLTATDYEFLFMQLLEGIAHGWHEGRVLKFFHTLDDRSRPRDWVAWLERFGEKVKSSSAPNQMLAARMMRLGELAQSFPEIEQIGVTSSKIGREIYAKTSENLVWEYEGPDLAEQSVIAELPPIETMETEAVIPETLTLDELFTRLQNDPELARLMGEQLGINTNDADTIVQALVNQFESTQGQSVTEILPTTADDWFERGLKQAEASDWEGAIISWDQALALEPDLAQAWHNRGSALGMLGRFEEALVSFDYAIALDPEDAQIWNIRGSVLYGLERWQEALDCWEKTLELENDYYAGWYNRGCVLEVLGQKEEAIASYEKALAIQPDFEVAQARLNDLLEGKS